MSTIKPLSKSTEDLEQILSILQSSGSFEIHIPSYAYNLIMHSDNRSIIFSTGNGVALASKSTYEVLKSAKISDAPGTALTYSEHNSVFFLGDRKGSVYIINSNLFKLEQKKQVFQSSVQKILINFDETLLYASLGSSEVVSLNLDLTEKKTLYSHNGEAALFLDLSPDGEMILSASEVDLKIYSVMQESIIREIKIESYKVSCIRFADSDRFAFGDTEGCIHVWRLNEWKEEVFETRDGGDVKKLCFGDGFFVSGHKNNFLRIWHDGKKKKPITVPTDGLITDISICDEFIYYAVPNLINFIKIPKSPDERYIIGSKGDISDLIYSSKNKTLISVSGTEKTVNIWSTENIDNIFLAQSIKSEACITSACLSADQRSLFAGLTNKTIVRWVFGDYNCELIGTSDISTSGLACSSDNRYLISIDTSCKCLVRSINDWKVLWSYTHHKLSGITVAVTHFSGILATLGTDHMIFLYDLETGKNIGKMEGFKSEGFKMSVSYDDRLLAVSTVNDGVYIFSIEKQWVLHRVPMGQMKSSKVVFTQDNKYLIIQGYGDGTKFVIFSLQDFQVITEMVLEKQSIYMCLVCDEKYLAVEEGGNIYIRENPLKIEYFSIIGPSFVYPTKYIKYINELNSGVHHRYDENMNKFVFLPTLMGTTHFYAYKNLTFHLEQVLKTGYSNYLTKNSSDIMTISLEKGLIDNIKIILTQVTEQLRTNPYAACFLENSLANLTKQPITELEAFYHSLMFCCNDKSLPRFSSYPDVFYNSQHFEVVPKFMIPHSLPKKPVKFHQSGVKVCSEIGSHDSIKFLNSLLHTGNREIFRSMYVEALLVQKWSEVKWFAQGYALFYFVQLLILSLFTLNHDYYYKVLLIVLNIVLFSYEVYQMALTGFRYFCEALNLIDFLRISLLVVYFLLDERHMEILFILNLTSWLRGISHFRIFTSTRYLVHLLIEVTKDILPFITLLFYFTLAFTFMMLALEGTNSYKDFYLIQDVYLMNFGSFSVSDKSSSWHWVCFVISSLVNFLVMINLLISIIADTYDKVQLNKQIADRREMVEIILEIENLMFWKRNENNKSYLQIMKLEESLEEESWKGKVRELQEAMIGVKTQIEGQKRELDEKLSLLSSDVSDIKISIGKLLKAQNIA